MSSASITERWLLIVCLASLGSSACDLPTCELTGFVEARLTRSTLEVDGIYQVTRSEPTHLEFSRDEGVLELSFPGTERALLPLINTDVELFLDVADDVYVVVRDASTGELLMEAGNTNASFAARETHMAFYELGGDADCQTRFGTEVSDAAIRFDTDDGPMILSAGTDATGTIEGSQYHLRAFGAGRLRHRDGVLDGASFFTNGLIVRSAD